MLTVSTIMNMAISISKNHSAPVDLCYDVIVKSISVARSRRESGLILSRSDFETIVRESLNSLIIVHA